MELTTTVEILSSLIRGNGKVLYLVTFIDTDDSEDTTTELWLGDDEEHLEMQVRCSKSGFDSIAEEQEEMPGFEYEWSETWGFTILSSVLGTTHKF